MEIKGIIFDLDGVIVSTDNCHYLAWKQMADKEGIYFDRIINERLRGVSRMESLNIILERSKKTYDERQKIELSEYKNNLYKELIQTLTPSDVLPGVDSCLKLCKKLGVKIAIGSSSKNTKLILERIGYHAAFDAVVDGNDISFSKPHPEVFLKAAKGLNLSPKECLVVEDANAGVDAGVSAGMEVFAVGFAARYLKAKYAAPSLSERKLKEILKV